MFSKTPVIYAVGTDYQFFFYLSRSAYAWIKVGDQVFEDTVCGNMRSLSGMRRLTVPQKLLNEAGSYTLCVEPVRDRKCYWTERLGVRERCYSFHPVPTEGEIRAYMIGDVHGDLNRGLTAAKNFGAFDFLIVNGDINESANIRRFELAHNLAAELCKGEYPVVYARGNHENRGAAAELMASYIPLRDGCTYYSFRLGSIWGVVLDCGEDKNDDHPEYGGYARFHKYREEETRYLQQLISRAESEFDAPDVMRRICVVHTPFACKESPEFDIEPEIFRTWCDLLEQMHIDVLLSAHRHCYQFLYPGDRDLRFSIPCPLVVGAANNKEYIGGSGILFTPEKTVIKFTASDGTDFPAKTL